MRRASVRAETAFLRRVYHADFSHRGREAFGKYSIYQWLICKTETRDNAGDNGASGQCRVGAHRGILHFRSLYVLLRYAFALRPSRKNDHPSRS
jgi:hypothetical protein